MSSNSKGQTLIEVIVASSVGILVVLALTFAVIFSLRNASFAKNQAQATKLAQEGMERVRSIRDRDGATTFYYSGGQTSKFSDLWSLKLKDSCEPCYFTLSSSNLNGGVVTSYEFLNNDMKRQVQISDDDTNYGKEKTISLIVKWTDFAGDHQSKLTTILRNTKL